MSNSGDALRRWLGAFFLAVAAGLLIWGQTILKPHLKGVVFLIYWLLCFACTLAAIVCAVLDVRALRKRTRQEHQQLFERSFEDVDKQRENKSSDPDA